MVVGEAEIQGQVKRAYEAALAKDTVGPLTNRLFKAALATGKRVRTETGIGERQLSLPAVAVALAREQLGTLTGREVVIVGTGENERAGRAGARRQRWQDACSSPAAGATGRCRSPGATSGRSVSFDELPAALLERRHRRRRDRVAARAARGRELSEVMAARGDRPLLLIDLAVPRDIDPSCAEIPGVSLYDIDDLQAVIARNRKVRQAEARKAEGIIEEEIQHFATWLGSLEVLPTIAALRARATEIADQVLRENDGKWEAASPRDLERIDALARAIVNRLLHDPTARLKELRDDRVPRPRGDGARPVRPRGRRRRPRSAGGRGAAGAGEIDLGAAAADADRHARERAGARAGARGWRERVGADAEIVTITTSGDRGARSGTSPAGCPSWSARCWTERIDIAVHSAKDVPAQLADGLELVAIPQRADPRDAICGSGSLAELPRGRQGGDEQPAARGSDPRRPRRRRGRERARQCRHSAAQAAPRASSTRSCSRSRGSNGSAAPTRPAACFAELVPAAGQGALAIEARTGAVPADLLAAVSDSEATACVTAERELVGALGGLMQHAGRRTRPPGRRRRGGAGRLGGTARRLGMDSRSPDR